MKYTLVTVVFEDELPLLQLQAASLRKFIAASMVETIVLIANSHDARFVRRLRECVQWYGHLAPLVVILDLNDFPRLPRTVGWFSQQLLKLLVARHVRTERYVVLDPKTHLIAPLTDAFLEHRDGRANMMDYPYTTHTLRPYLERTLRYLHLDPDQYVQKFPFSAPPFIIYTDVANDLIKSISQASGRTFEEEFINQKLTEFFLYSAWVVKKFGSIEKLYSYSKLYSPTIWEHKVEISQIKEELAHGAGRSPFINIHRRSIFKMRNSGLEYIAQLWTSAGLFEDQQSAIEFIKGYKKAYILAFYREIAVRKMRRFFEKRLAKSTPS
jgi:hypothetical protein